MGIVILCAGCALIGYLIGLFMADRIATYKIAEMRSQMGLDIDTGEEINGNNDLFKEQ